MIRQSIAQGDQRAADGRILLNFPARFSREMATIASFLRDLWTDYMKCGRSREGTGEKLK